MICGTYDKALCKSKPKTKDSDELNNERAKKEREEKVDKATIRDSKVSELTYNTLMHMYSFMKTTQAIANKAKSKYDELKKLSGLDMLGKVYKFMSPVINKLAAVGGAIIAGLIAKKVFNYFKPFLTEQYDKYSASVNEKWQSIKDALSMENVVYSVLTVRDGIKDLYNIFNQFVIDTKHVYDNRQEYMDKMSRFSKGMLTKLKALIILSTAAKGAEIGKTIYDSFKSVGSAAAIAGPIVGAIGTQTLALTGAIGACCFGGVGGKKGGKKPRPRSKNMGGKGASAGKSVTTTAANATKASFGTKAGNFVKGLKGGKLVGFAKKAGPIGAGITVALEGYNQISQEMMRKDYGFDDAGYALADGAMNIVTETVDFFGNLPLGLINMAAGTDLDLNTKGFYNDTKLKYGNVATSKPLGKEDYKKLYENMKSDKIPFDEIISTLSIVHRDNENEFNFTDTFTRYSLIEALIEWEGKDSYKQTKPIAHKIKVATDAERRLEAAGLTKTAKGYIDKAGNFVDNLTVEKIKTKASSILEKGKEAFKNSELSIKERIKSEKDNKNLKATEETAKSTTTLKDKSITFFEKILNLLTPKDEKENQQYSGSSSYSGGSVNVSKSKEENFKLLERNATIASKATGLPKKFIIAQQIQENGWNGGTPTGKNNFFNIKADKSWKGKKSQHKVHEIINGKKVWVNAWFRDYDDPNQSAKDYATFLKTNPRYKNLLNKNLTANQASDIMGKTGYATDPNYGDNIKNIMQGKTFNTLYKGVNNSSSATGGSSSILDSAKMDMGVREVKGAGNNARVSEYHLNTSAGDSTDEVPWCSSFVNFHVKKAGYKGTNSKAAKSWATWGLGINSPRVGCIAVKARKGGNHVGIVASVDFAKGRLGLLGGNQGNFGEVKISSYPIGVFTNFRIPGPDQQGGSGISGSTATASIGGGATGVAGSILDTTTGAGKFFKNWIAKMSGKAPMDNESTLSSVFSETNQSSVSNISNNTPLDQRLPSFTPKIVGMPKKNNKATLDISPDTEQHKLLSSINVNISAVNLGIKALIRNTLGVGNNGAVIQNNVTNTNVNGDNVNTTTSTKTVSKGKDGIVQDNLSFYDNLKNNIPSYNFMTG